MTARGLPAHNADRTVADGDIGGNPAMQRLLKKGVALATAGKTDGPELRKDLQLLLEESAAALAPGKAAQETKNPEYKAGEHELWWDGCRLKKWKRAGTQQEELVQAFAEQDWPPRIDNPFTDPDEDCHDLLLNTLKNLKKALPRGPIHFTRDGQCGVRWWIENT